MTTILIVCGAGASSTFLASRMRALLRSASIDASVEPITELELGARLTGADLVLLGPHLSPRRDELFAIADAGGVPIAVLPANAYGPTGAADAIELSRSFIRLSAVPPIHSNEGALDA